MVLDLHLWKSVSFFVFVDIIFKFRRHVCMFADFLVQWNEYESMKITYTETISFKFQKNWSGARPSSMDVSVIFRFFGQYFEFRRHVCMFADSLVRWNEFKSMKITLRLFHSTLKNIEVVRDLHSWKSANFFIYS